MTNNDLIEQALRLIGVLAEGMTATAEQSSDALVVMNQIADDWAEDGIALNWAEQTDPTATLSLVGPERSAMQYELAIRLSPVFGREPSPSVAMLANQSRRRILRTAINLANRAVSTGLPLSEANNYQYDILTG